MSELTARRRKLVLAICCLSFLLIGMDNTIVNVALPALRRDFSASVSSLQWTIDAYTLVLAGFLMLSGSTADRVGRRRTFQVGLAVFGLGSLLCSLAPGVGWLVAARVLQACGGSMLNPVAMSIITTTHTDRAERARAIGIWGAVAGLSLGLGPIVGGALVDTAGWRSVFWVNVPIVLAALVGTALYVPESRAERPRRFDPVGQALVILVLGSVVYAIIEAPRLGWTSGEILALAGIAVAGVAGLLIYEPHRPDPLLELRFFHSVPFSGTVLLAVAGYCGYGSFLFLNTLYLQDIRGMSALRAGLCTLPVAVLVVLLAPIAGQVVGRRGPRAPMVVAGLGMALAGLAFTGLTPGTPLFALLGGYLLVGIAQGTINPPITTAAVSGMPTSMAGVAASVAATSVQAGATLGVAISGSIIGRSLAAGPAPFTEATHAVWWLLCALGVLVCGLGLLTTSRWGRSTARRAADLFDTVNAGTVAVSRPGRELSHLPPGGSGV